MACNSCRPIGVCRRQRENCRCSLTTSHPRVVVDHGDAPCVSKAVEEDLYDQLKNKRGVTDKLPDLDEVTFPRTLCVQ